MWKISKFANLSDFIIVGDVDASRHTRASKGENIKAVEKIKNIAKGTTDPRVEFIFPK